MKRTHRLPAGAAVVAAVAATAGAVVAAGSNGASTAAPDAPPSTATVERGKLSATVSLDGTLTYRARSDGSPYAVINRARGTYTRLPAEGDRVDCGDVLYRVDDDPVLLLCGPIPAYRTLRKGDRGEDVRQLNRNLRRLGYGADRDDTDFTQKTKDALERLQHRTGAHASGVLHAGDAIVLPRSVRIAKVAGEPGGTARPGARVAQATSDTLEVQVRLDASQQRDVRRGDRAQITLPGNTVVKGRVGRIGRVAHSAGKDAGAGDATIPASIRLDEPEAARGLDRAPVQVDIATRGVADALSVPVTALVGRSGGGLAVEVVRAGARRELVPVKVGLFDTGGGRVQVEGDLREGDAVVVPSL